jgi:peptidoglycan/xylan/chitin deacetylase (PgdA/CDA1 family)
MNDLLILNYHSIFESEEDGKEDSVYSVHAKEFRKQMEFIQMLGYKVVPVDSLMSLKPDNTPYVAITFDDANPSDYLFAAPILNEFGFKATFYLPVNKLTDAIIQQYQVLLESGHKLGAHGITHSYFTDLDVKTQHSELDQSKKMIEAIFSTTNDYFALPGGKYSKETIDLAKQTGFKGLLTTKFGYIDFDKPSYLLNRYTIKRKTSFTTFQRVLLRNKTTLMLETNKSKMKKMLNLFLSNQMIDRLNYKLNK